MALDPWFDDIRQTVSAFEYRYLALSSKEKRMDLTVKRPRCLSVAAYSEQEIHI